MKTVIGNGSPVGVEHMAEHLNTFGTDASTLRSVREDIP